MDVYLLVFGAVIFLLLAAGGALFGLIKKRTFSPPREQDEELSFGEAERLREEICRDDKLCQIINEIVRDFSSYGIRRNHLRFNHNVCGIHIITDPHAVRCVYQYEKVPRWQEDRLDGQWNLLDRGIRELSPQKAAALEAVILEALKAQCPGLEISKSGVLTIG